MSKRKKTKKNIVETLKRIEFNSEAELDYHGMGPLTAYDIEKILNEFIEDAYIAKMTYVLIITGKGQVVRPTVQKLLKQNKYVKLFKTAGYFNGQGGAIEVEINN